MTASSTPPATAADWAPALRSSIMLRRDDVTGGDLLVMPERVVVLNETSAATLRLCDGHRTVDDIAATLADRYGAPIDEVRADVAELVGRMRREGWLR